VESGPHSRLEAPTEQTKFRWNPHWSNRRKPQPESQEGQAEGDWDASRRQSRARIGDEAPTPNQIVSYHPSSGEGFLVGGIPDSRRTLLIPTSQGKGRGTVHTPIELQRMIFKQETARLTPGGRLWFFEPNNQDTTSCGGENASGAYTLLDTSVTLNGGTSSGSTGVMGREQSVKKPLQVLSRTRGPTFSTMGKSGTTSFTHSPPPPSFRHGPTAMSHDMKDPGSRQLARVSARTTTQEELRRKPRSSRSVSHSTTTTSLPPHPSPYLLTGPPTRLFLRVFADENPLERLGEDRPYRRPRPHVPPASAMMFGKPPQPTDQQTVPKPRTCCFCSPSYSLFSRVVPHRTSNVTEVDWLSYKLATPTVDARVQHPPPPASGRLLLASNLASVVHHPRLKLKWD